MSVLSAQSIRRLGLVRPSVDKGIDSRGNSYGLSACSYDIRVDHKFCLKAHGFIKVGALEYFRLPNNVVGYVKDKSSLARDGMAVQNTLLDPGWCGYLTLELSNNDAGVDLLFEEGDAIAQVVFHWLDEPTELPYVGKYQQQERGPQEARKEKVDV